MSAGPLVRGWRWRLIGPGGPPLTRALTVGEAVRGCLINTAKRLTGSHLLPPCLHGDPVSPEPTHTHAFYRPEDLDGDGRIDHVLVFASGGLDRFSLSLLAGCETLFLGRSEQWVLEPCWMGSLPVERCYGPAQTWRSLTPYCPSAHSDHSGRSRDMTALIRRETRVRKLPDIVAVEQLERAGAEEFVVSRKKGMAPPNERHRPSAAAGGPDPTEGREPTRAFLRLDFAEPVTGPLALGFGCHFGLGLFIAADLWSGLRPSRRSDPSGHPDCRRRTG